MRFAEHIRGWRDAVAGNADRFETYALATAFMFVIYHDSEEPLQSAFQLAAAAALLVRAVRHSAVFWFAVGGIILAQVGWKWATANNHDFLLGYWCLALGLAATRPDPMKVLSRTGPLLVGLVFALATVYKLATPDYMSGDFFEMTMLTDSRFEPFVHVTTGLDPEVLQANDRIHDDLSRHDSVDTRVEFESNGLIRPLALVTTYWTLLIEGALALAFLAGRPRAPAGVWLLILFAVSTYLVAPVVGFGAMLMMMACAGTEARFAWTRASCLALFVAFPAFDMIWKVVVLCYSKLLLS